MKNYKTPQTSEANRPKVEIGRADKEKEYKENEKEIEKQEKEICTRFIKPR